ncbi:TetR/AcrR family transcriptional regulator [Prauserella alba]|uniref:TetR/AcrR family transcriptional regulator n=1 Tax=Prauserella alba TaxID=176898 RepID=UPI0020A44A6A|nr:TetR/AcrR family transcriptional regulator [Prauserella alba]MCP2183307.1 transcriptional regulator, TetR family [Prauserella alba]
MTAGSEVEGGAKDGGVTDNGVKGRILDAAAEAFMRRGFGSTTIDDIADDVGATKGLIYYHFRSKFDVFLAVYEEGMRRVREHVESHACGDGSGRDRLVAMSQAHVLNLMRDIAYHNVVHQGVRAKESTELKIRQRDALAALNDLRTDYERLFHRVLATGIEDGSIREVDAALATRTLLSSLNAVDMWYRRIDGQSDDDIQDLARQVVDVLIGGIAAPGQEPATAHRGPASGA